MLGRYPLHTIWLVSSLSAQLACSHRAAIIDREGREIQGTIVGADTSRVYIVPGEWSSAPRPVDRDAIAHIDHPGTGAIVAGAGLTGLGALSALGAVSRVSAGDEPVDHLLGAGVVSLVGGVGVALLVRGLGVNRASRRAARPEARSATAWAVIDSRGIGVRF